MTKTEILLTILSVLSAIIAAILSVIISYFLQNKSKKREEKLHILIDLMISRIYGWTPNAVHSMNIIDIVFADNKDVKNAWHDYFNKCKVKNPSDQQLKDIEIAKNKLIEKIAIDLGYKDKLTWDEIQSVYVPNGLLDDINKQQEFQKLQFLISQTISNMLTDKNEKSN